MAYFDPLRQAQIPQNPSLGATQQYMQMSVPPILPGQTTALVGASPPPIHGRQRVVPRIVNAPYMPPQIMGQQPAYSTSQAAQYIAGTPGMQPGPQVNPMAAGQYAQPSAPGYAPQAYPGQAPMAQAGVPIPGAGAQNGGATSYSYPGTATPYSHGHHEGHFPGGHHHRRRKRKSKLRKILEELLEGSVGIAAANYLHNRHDRQQGDNPVASAPRGSALGFLHPQGHFVPRPLEDMIDHFVHGRRDRDVAPEGSKPGYLHPGGHFVPMPIEHLIDEFKWTLLHNRGGSGRRHHHQRHGPAEAGAAGATAGTALGRRNRQASSSSSGTEYYTDTGESGGSSGSEADYGRHGRHR